MDKLDLRDLNLPEMEELVGKLRAEPYRAKQIFSWVHARGATGLDDMSDLPAWLRKSLDQSHGINSALVRSRQVSDNGQTRKYLLSLADGQLIETVCMLYRRHASRDRRTACISSQVGCSMACRFCATGKLGFKRNLSAGELVGQVYFWNRELASAGSPGGITNVVYMGMGEPLLNYEAVLKSIRLLGHPLGLDLGYRRLTISTCGIPEGIRRLADEGLQVRLAVSLHAADDMLRSRLLPVNRRFPLAQLMEACRYYVKRTGRKVTFAYLLLEGINDSLEQAQRMAQLLHGLPSKVNLIPFNRVEGKEFRRPQLKIVYSFARFLASRGFEVSVREERGSEIAAACGQLRGRVVKNR